MRHCETCGRAIEDAHPFSVCPECLFAEALEAGTSRASPSEAEASGTAAQPIAEKPGDQIGRYRLLEPIGEGGCGVVYRAEQLEPIRRTVALKVIKLGMDTKEVIARFEVERQALALMDHPNIAKVLDAGATATGRPYFVMELVQGIKITHYCDEHRLSPAQRLALFTQVCHAVQHAHQKGVVHRDIKPSNILVTQPDPAASGCPKIIDFGIAKATEQPLTDKTLLTAFAQFMGTPAYMSPEQAGLSGLDIDTRTDIYSLGVLLYELLTGQTPFDARSLLKAGLDEICRVVREEEPQRPSTRLGALDGAESTLAAKRRQLELPRLITALRGDLDWIVMKCLEKDRKRRYETANALAEDVERHLRDEPVSAAAPSVAYQISKFVRRHRTGFAMASALAVLLLTGAAVSTWQAVRASRAEREQARLLAEARSARDDADEQRRRAEDEREKAEKQSAEAERQREEAEGQKQEAEKQRNEAELQRTNAIAALKVADYERERAAQESSRASNEWRRAEAALRDVERMLDFMLFDLSEKLLPVGRVDLMQSVTEEVLEYYRSLPAGNGSDESQSRRYAAFKNLGQVLAAQGESAQALESFRTSLAIAEEMAKHSQEAQHWQGEVASCHEKLGEFWLSRGNSTRALQEFRASLEIIQPLASEVPSRPHWQRSRYTILIHLGDTYQMRGEPIRALSSYESAMEIAQMATQAAPQSDAWQRSLAHSSGKIGWLRLQEGDLDQALHSCNRSLEIAKQRHTKQPGNPQVQMELAWAHDNFGKVLMAKGETKTALEHYARSMALRQGVVKTDPGNTEWQRAMLQSYLQMGRALSQMSPKYPRWDTFIESFLVLKDIFEKHIELTRKFVLPGDVLEKPLEASRQSVELARQLAEKDPANLQWQNDLAQSHSLLADLLVRADQRGEALKEYRAALHLREKVAQADTNAIVFQYESALAHANVAAALQRLSEKDEAVVEARKAFHILADLTARWPGNLAFLKGPRTGENIIRQQAPIIPSQRQELGVAMKDGYKIVEGRAAQRRTDARQQEDLAAYCQEMMAYSLLFGNSADMLVYAERSVAVWRYLFEALPANPRYGRELVQAYVSLGALQLNHHHPASACRTALEGLELDSESLALKAVLALAQLFTGDYEAARLVLDKARTVEARSGDTFSAVIASDARALRARGLTPMDPEQFEAALRADSESAVPQ